MKNKANLPGRDCFGASLFAMTPVREDAGLQNKANSPGRGRFRPDGCVGPRARAGIPGRFPPSALPWERRRAIFRGE